MVNKLPEDLDDPIDSILYNRIDHDLPYFRKLCLTPNMITTLSLVFSLAGIYNFYHDKNIVGSILFFMGYYFDCADGKMARKYKMVSQFGDLYDHISDIVKFVILIYVMLHKSNKHLNKIIIVGIVIGILTGIQMSCQEKIYNESNNKNESKSLELLSVFNVSDCQKTMRFTRFFSTGTFMLYNSLIILLWNKINQL